MLGIAGVASSFAQNVYSVNVVGYMTLTLSNSFSLIANQLDDGAGNVVTNLLGGTTIPGGTKIYKFNGTSYDILTWNGVPLNRWTPATLAGTMTMAPGEGVFVKNPTAPTPITVTFVGEVMQGTLVNPVAAGFDVYSGMVPQDGGIAAVHGFVPQGNDYVYKFNGVTYGVYKYNGAPLNRWTPSEPQLTVGEAVFMKAVAARDWTRTFTVQ